ncbi:ribonuclease P protein subunit p38-like [Saccoglossus kowalevskii]|uniref:Ribonuclease P protein subunit p38-like n=1 Tax=Saccoglossus kowalevskii TaxID=10224 RepID=A0ABM0M932_SACKO|nr:PREDICTED: ribonuclease P protein subunit p38-like [Saccoglossus kowalevskii]
MATKKDNFTVKNSMDSPYGILQWPRLHQGEQVRILDEIKSIFQPLKDQLKKGKSKNRKKTAKMKALEVSEKPEETTVNSSNLRSQLALGINEVTKGLERDLIRLAIVCKSAKPVMLTAHLIPLCVSRNTSAVCLTRLSEILSPIFGFTSLLAIGFKKLSKDESSIFDELVEFVSSRAPILEVPWLKHQEEIAKKVANLKTNVQEISTGIKEENDDVRQTGNVNIGAHQTELEQTSLSIEEPVLTGSISFDASESVNTAERVLEPPTKKRKVQQIGGKDKKKQKQTKYHELTVKQMKNIPNEKRQNKKRKKKQRKSK